MNFPTYDGSEPLYLYRERLNEYLIKLKKEEYVVVLELFNKILNKKYKSLTEIKKINMDLYDINNIISIIKENKSILDEKFNIDVNNLESEEQVIKIIKNLVLKINFSFLKKDKNNYFITAKE